MEIDVSKVDREVLLAVKNSINKDVLRRYPHLQGVRMDDIDLKPAFPVHLILGASEYAKIKTNAKVKIGKPADPVGEQKYSTYRDYKDVSIIAYSLWTPTVTEAKG